MSLTNAKVLTEPGKFPIGRRWGQKDKERNINQTNAVGAARMMLGEMNGAVLLLAKQIATDGSSRVGGEQNPLLLGGKGGETFLFSECVSGRPPAKSDGKGGGSGFGGGQGSNDGSNTSTNLYGHIVVNSTTPCPKGNDTTNSWGARQTATHGYSWVVPPGYMGIQTVSVTGSYLKGGMGAAGACILVVSETSPDELHAVMSSGGLGGKLTHAVFVNNGLGNGLLVGTGEPGGGSGQLMYFHVGGDA